MGNKELEHLLKELKNTNSEIKVHHSSGIYFGKINKIKRKTITLKPYAIPENIKINDTNYLERIRIEDEIGLVLDKTEILPIKLSKGYMENFIKAVNYFSWKSVKNDKLKNILFEGYPLPTEEEIKILEGETPTYFGK